MEPKKHTPGPWSTDPEVGHEAVLGPDGIMVADCAIFVSPKFGKRSAKTNAANASLIAAAPNLLDALKAFSIYTIEEDDGGIRFSAGGVCIAHHGDGTPEGIALLKLSALQLAALSRATGEGK